MMKNSKRLAEVLSCDKHYYWYFNLPYPVLTTTPKHDDYHYYSPFMDEETEAPIHGLTCPSPQG